MKNTFKFILLICFVFSVSSVKCQNGEPKSSIKEELEEWINYLASDKMRGRANGSPEMALVAEWLAGKYKEYGLKPLLNESGFVQNYSFTSRGRNFDEHNVIGMIEGSDPLLKDEFIILSAHFDHIGVRKGNSADTIYNGADDNAAGTATLLGVAKTIRDSGLKPGRSIIFAAFSGEEAGIRGSRYFVANSPGIIKKGYANVNFEMTGHSEYLGKNNYYMTGCKVSDLDDLIGEFNKESNFTLVDTIAVSNNLFFASDNIAFSRISTENGISKGIPSGTFATTALADYIHSPGDEAKLFDFENMAGLVDYFAHMVVWLSENKKPIMFTDPSFTRI